MYPSKYISHIVVSGNRWGDRSMYDQCNVRARSGRSVSERLPHVMVSRKEEMDAKFRPKSELGSRGWLETTGGIPYLWLFSMGPMYTRDHMQGRCR
jgi:hypothetical protein